MFTQLSDQVSLLGYQTDNFLVLVFLMLFALLGVRRLMIPTSPTHMLFFSCSHFSNRRWELFLRVYLCVNQLLGNSGTLKPYHCLSKSLSPHEIAHRLPLIKAEIRHPIMGM
jgi:hypothetical protein